MTFGARSRRPVLAMTAREREQQRVAALAVKIAGYLEERGPTRKTVLREALCIASESRYELALRGMPVKRKQLGADHDQLLTLHPWRAT